MAAEQLSSEEASKQWKFLIEIENLKPTTEREEARTKKKTKKGSTSLSTTSDSSSGARKRKRSRLSSLSSSSTVVGNDDNDSDDDDDDDDEDDPFSCKCIAVLPTHDIVENALKEYANEWKQLDDRKVNKAAKVSTKDIELNDDEDDDEDDGNISVNNAIATTNATKTTKTKRHAGGWRSMDDKRLSLPERFNYAGGGPPPDDGYSAGGGDRVISLDNPTQTLSYHKELWKLFNSIPTYRQLEDMARSGNQVNNTLRMYQETHAVKAGTADYHALSRLRMPDRHGLPPYYVQSSSKQRLITTTTTNNNNNNNNNNSQTDTTSTITFEIWRRQPKRGAPSDCHRMVLEFRACQTLWDLHMILSQMAEDELWNAVVAAGAGAGDNNTCTENENDDTDIAITNTNSNSNSNSNSNNGNDEDENDNDGGEDTHQHEQPSGCFFIENNFYKTGSVDYTKPIMNWIDNNSNKPNPIRRGYLGISSSIPITNDKTMKDTKLSQVPFRLNIRYYHACHGDVETAVMLVDRKLIHFNRDQNDSDDKVVYPLIHDIWTAPRVPAVPLCDACQIYQAVFVTSTDCNTTDGGPRAICHECCTDLKLLEKEKQSVKLIIPWRNQADLSNRIAREHDKNF
jgi:hypothetical protein